MAEQGPTALAEEAANWLAGVLAQNQAAAAAEAASRHEGTLTKAAPAVKETDAKERRAAPAAEEADTEERTHKGQFKWTHGHDSAYPNENHAKFEAAIQALGIHAKPQAILEFMQIGGEIEGLTRRHIKSHLQKFRLKAGNIASKQTEALAGLTMMSYAQGEAPPAEEVMAEAARHSLPPPSPLVNPPPPTVWAPTYTYKLPPQSSSKPVKKDRWLPLPTPRYPSASAPPHVVPPVPPAPAPPVATPAPVLPPVPPHMLAGMGLRGPPPSGLAPSVLAPSVLQSAAPTATPTALANASKGVAEPPKFHWKRPQGLPASMPASMHAQPSAEPVPYCYKMPSPKHAPQRRAEPYPVVRNTSAKVITWTQMHMVK